MKRSTKNIIMILISIILIGGIVFTISYAKKHLENQTTELNNYNPRNNIKEELNNPPQKPEDNQGFKKNLEIEGQEINKQDNQNQDKGENMTPPEMPNGNNSDMMFPNAKGDKQEKGNIFNGEGNIDNASNKVTLTSGYYIILGGLSCCLSLLIIYLIISQFNKKTCKETFETNDKKVIYILGGIILTGVLTLSLAYISNNYILDNKNDNSINEPNNQNNMKMMDNPNISYSASEEINSDSVIESKEYSSNEENQNALLVNGDIDVKLSNISVTKTKDSQSGDNTSFYGINSAILAKSGANLTIENANITTDAKGANGIFSYGGSATTNNTTSDGTTITVSNSKIVTKSDNSGGLMTTGGGITNANNLDIITNGTSSAAIRSDRGGGKVTINEGNYTTNGKGSPVIYSTADINVKNSILTSNVSEGVVIEGSNNVTLDNCTLTDTNNQLNGQFTTYKNIFLYQSMSGDASSGMSSFTAKDSSITTNKGDTFYVTNTMATISLENNKIINNDSKGNFLRVQKDSWGNSGSNGGNVTLKLTNQNVEGNIVVDSLSSLTLIMKNNSTYEGSINIDDDAKLINLKLDRSSKIKLTKDSYVTSFEDEDTDYSNIDFNGYKLYVNGKAIN